ncbi:MAG: hypothetical protein M3552_01620, partial [Planctomycetota bacterium]|nr:hypothetical protein [Planctomycetota bacterium]
QVPGVESLSGAGILTVPRVSLREGRRKGRTESYDSDPRPARARASIGHDRNVRRRTFLLLNQDA